MAFRFPLQSIFHLRQSVEHQQELRLRAANQQVGRVRHLIEQIDARILQQQAEYSRELAAGTHAAEIQFAISIESSLREGRRELHLELLRLTQLRDQQQRLFQQARRERETFEILRDHQLREYVREHNRSEQRQLDELFLARQAYRRRS